MTSENSCDYIVAVLLLNKNGNKLQKREYYEMDNYDEYFKNKVNIVRNQFVLKGYDMDEHEAMKIIEYEVGNNSNGMDFDIAQFDLVVKQLYTKTRCKLGILEELINRDSINEIMVNGIKDIFIEENGKLKKFYGSFDSVEELEEIIRNIAAGVHREINEMNPIVDARLDNGSRVNGVYKNIAINGPILTIRKFSKNDITMNNLVQYKTLTEECARYLENLTILGFNIFISGGTSSGKTTFLNALGDNIPKQERVIVIEDSAELKLNNLPNIVHMECHNANSMGQGSITMDKLINTSLRMRPDRIIVGEVRGKEVSDMLQAMNTGHDGSMSTGHGNSVNGMLRRLEAMYLMSAQIPIDAIRAQIAEGIDIIVHLERLYNGERKVVEIAEIVDFKNGEFVTNQVFNLNDNSELVPTGNQLVNRAKLKRRREISG